MSAMTDLLEFKKWPSLVRAPKAHVTITEKIDGTNAAVVLAPTDGMETPPPSLIKVVDHEVGPLAVLAQSRKRFITPADDNFGFAAWAAEHAEQLAFLLGPGRHFGEWWGQGIQRSYDLNHKRFSLFSPWRYDDLAFMLAGTEYADFGLDIVPILKMSALNGLTGQLAEAMETLRSIGSVAAPGYDDPEGVVIQIQGVDQAFKHLLVNPDGHKWQQAA